jgi:hypothetical protein
VTDGTAQSIHEPPPDLLIPVDAWLAERQS